MYIIRAVTFRESNNNKDKYRELSIKCNIWKLMFDQVINPTIKCIDTLLNDDKLKGKCKYLCLVGGLSTSTYFNEKINKNFGEKSKYKLTIIVPQRPLLSVVQGAAYFGITSNYIKARILKYTYGVAASCKIRTARSMGVPEDHIEEHKDDMDYVASIFSVIIRKDQEVRTGNPAVHKIRRRGARFTCGDKIILCSEKLKPTILSHGKELGTIEMKYDETDDDTQECLLMFHFDDALIKVETFKIGKTNEKKVAYIDVANCV